MATVCVSACACVGLAGNNRHNMLLLLLLAMWCYVVSRTTRMKVFMDMQRANSLAARATNCVSRADSPPLARQRTSEIPQSGRLQEIAFEHKRPPLVLRLDSWRGWRWRAAAYFIRGARKLQHEPLERTFAKQHANAPTQASNSHRSELFRARVFVNKAN